MIKCYILDDELPAIEVIKKYINKQTELSLVGYNINPIDAIEEIKSCEVDLVFLDVQMDELNGLEVIKKLGNSYKYVLCTAYSEFAIDGFELDVMDYLLKPISYQRFEKSISRYNRVLNSNMNIKQDISDDYIYVKTETKGKMIKIDINEIKFIEGRSNYVAFHLKSRTVLSYITLKEVEERLMDSKFVRVHKSYIVPIKHIESVQKNELTLQNLVFKIPLSSHYKESFYSHIEPKLLGLYKV